MVVSSPDRRYSKAAGHCVEKHVLQRKKRRPPESVPCKISTKTGLTSENAWNRESTVRQIRFGLGGTHRGKGPDIGPKTVIGQLTPSTGVADGSIIEHTAEDVD